MSRASLALELERASLRLQPALSEPGVCAKWCPDAAYVSLLGFQLAASRGAVQVSAGGTERVREL